MLPRDSARERKSSERPQETPVPSLPVAYGGSYRPLSDDDVDAIYQAALTVLAEVGIEVTTPAPRSIWLRAGAQVDGDADRVYIPRSLTAETLGSAAPRVTLYGQVPEYDVELGGKRVFLGTGGAAVKVVHLDGVVRESCLRDLCDIGRLVDSLRNIHFYHRPVIARDVPEEVLDVNTFYACLSATQKHVMGSFLASRHVEEVCELAALVAGGRQPLRERPIISGGVSWMVSPLRCSAENVETLHELVQQGIPIVLSSAPQAGTTAPIALAGTLVQLLAEQISGAVYVNLLRPGHPVLLGCVPSVSDMRTGAFSGGGPEFALMNAAAAQLALRAGLPVYVSAGVTDSKVPDAQAGYEKGMSTAIAGLAGANYIHHSAGMLESLMAVAYEQYVVDDDINGSVMRLVRGIEVTEESLSLKVIKDVCQGPGHFLSHQQTLDMMKSEYYYPHTADRDDRGAWEEKGGLDMRERARIRARDLLDRHWPAHIPERVDRQIRQRFSIRLPRTIMAPHA